MKTSDGRRVGAIDRVVAASSAVTVIFEGHIVTIRPARSQKPRRAYSPHVVRDLRRMR
ncbi:hypothetical protein AB5I41_14410 [Sphingomonas sp. MMS24-JH45]